MVKSYSKGYRRERSLVHTLAKRGYMVVRTPRSGRIGLASPDIIAAKDGRLVVIECKAREEAFTVPKEQLDELREWEEKALASAYIAWKVSREDWIFLTLKDVSDNNGNVGKKFAKEKGVGIELVLG